LEEFMMIKKSFFNLAGPRLNYSIIASDPSEAVEIRPKDLAVTVITGWPDMGLRTGTRLKTGQRVALGNGSYFIAPVTGHVSAVSRSTGYLDKALTEISIRVGGEDEWDEGFKASESLSPAERIEGFLHSVPGAEDLGFLVSLRENLRHIVVAALDGDLLVTTNCYVLKRNTEDIRAGIEILRKVFERSKILFLFPEESGFQGTFEGIETRGIRAGYPGFSPKILCRSILGIEVPTGVTCDQMGVGFLSAEAVASIGRAFSTGKIPLDKIITVIKKDGEQVHAKVRIGTPASLVLELLEAQASMGDRLISGGPMAGITLSSANAPVLPDTDALMIQDAEKAPPISDVHCVNCGECVRACPARVPVNMLIRLLQNRLYDEAVRAYDLLSCIECGLCSYVCPAAIPIFHYLMLGKYEYERARASEVTNAK
jgi:electron transport complex protein RnfC